MIPAAEAAKLEPRRRRRGRSARRPRRLRREPARTLRRTQRPATPTAPTSATSLARYPAIHDVVIWNEPNKRLFWNPQAGTRRRAYEALLARCYDVLHAVRERDRARALVDRQRRRGLDLAGGVHPRCRRRLPRERPDRPHPRHGRPPSVRARRGGAALAQAHRGRSRSARATGTSSCSTSSAPSTARPSRSRARRACGSGTREVGFQTAVDAGKAGAYSGTENTLTVPDWAGGEPESPAPAETTRRPDQATQALDAIRLAACQPYVTALLQLPARRRARARGLAVGRALGRPDAEGLLARLPAGDRSRDHRHRRLRLRSRAAGRAPTSCRRTCRPGSPARRSPARCESTCPGARPRTTSAPVAYRVFRNGAHVAHDLGHELVERERRAGDDLHVRGARDRRRRQPRRRIRVGHGDDARGARAGGARPAPGGGGGGSALPPDLGVALATSPTQPIGGTPADAIVTVFNDAAAGTASAVTATIELPPGSS